MFKIGNITLSFEQYDKFLIFFFREAVGKGGVQDLIQFFSIKEANTSLYNVHCT